MIVAGKKGVSTIIEDDVAILDLDNGICYRLNEVGALVCVIHQPRTVPASQDRTVSEYGVLPKECASDLLRLLEHLKKAGLIEVSDESFS